MRKIIYLASPHTHTDKAVLDARCIAAQKATARLMLEGNAVFSPIAHSHGVADHMPDAVRCDGDFWMEQDLPLLAKCDEMIVLRLDGWRESSGVRQELAFAAENGIPVSFVDE